MRELLGQGWVPRQRERLALARESLVQWRLPGSQEREPRWMAWLVLERESLVRCFREQQGFPSRQAPVRVQGLRLRGAWAGGRWGALS